MTSYRPDIDGLRGIAIGLVLIFHFFPKFLPHGFVGVDVFFVISGYLISLKILNSLSTKTFSFKQFYFSRILRLYPALMLTTLAALIMSWLILIPTEFQELCKHVFYCAFWGTNFSLYQETGYFDHSSEFRPLLHLWSLAIEEQFYLCWPLILIFLRKSKYFFQLLICGTILSFLAYCFLNNWDVDHAFFMPWARVWEFLLGGILVVWKRTLPSNEKNHLILAGSLGFLILSQILLIDFGPSINLLSCLGALGLILSGNSSSLSKYVLENSFIRFLGKISYPLYLWHWPLLALFKLTHKSTLSFVTNFSLLGFSVILATLTFYAVELPLKKVSKKILFFSLLALSLTTLVIGWMGSQSLLSPRNHSPAIQKISNALNEGDYLDHLVKKKVVPLNFERKYLVEGKEFRVYVERLIESHQKTILFFGDSNMQHYFPRMEELAKDKVQNRKRIFFTSRGGCVPFKGIRGKKTHSKSCTPYLESIEKFIESHNFDTIVMSYQWVDFLKENSHLYFENEFGEKDFIGIGNSGYSEALNKLDHLLSFLSANTKKVVLLLSSPYGEKLDPRQALNRSAFSRAWVNNNQISLDSFNESYGKILSDIKFLTQSHHVYVLDPLDALCDTKDCFALTDSGEPKYFDSLHLRPSYVREKINYLDSFIMNNGDQK
ncbi:MAG: acyltransferase family protein [Bacteriovoracaceae bacterium]|nr:acyltransferase family protein [Bacteriovoracaceae bacterium]